MACAEAVEIRVRQETLSESEVRTILSRPDGPYALLEMVRLGRIDAETAVKQIDNTQNEPFMKRLFVALIDTIFRK
jgi:hypothetical protein